MKTMKILGLLTALISVGALADTVSGVTATQHWPWDGKVDISYTLTATTQKTTPVFTVSFQGRVGDKEPFDLTTLEGDGSVGLTLGAGEKRIVWDASKDAPGTKTDDFTIAVTAEDVTDQADYLKLDLITYKMTNETSEPTDPKAKYQQIWFRRVENGTFTMGSASNETGRSSDDLDEHNVTITKAFYIGIYELTVSQYNTIESTGDSKITRPKAIDYDSLRGITYGATWPTKSDFRVDAKSFFGLLRSKTGNGIVFDLPTEAQWEMACRAKGDGTYWGSGVWNDGSAIQGTDPDTNLNDLGWYKSNSNDQLQIVGDKTPNSIGLYDMHGNISELCLDYMGSDITETVDPKGPAKGKDRVAKGGAFSKDFTPDKCRQASRRGVSADTTDSGTVGVRIVLQP